MSKGRRRKGVLLQKGEGENLPFFYLFVPARTPAHVGWYPPTLRADLPHSVQLLTCQFSQETFSQTHLGHPNRSNQMPNHLGFSFSRRGMGLVPPKTLRRINDLPAIWVPLDAVKLHPKSTLINPKLVSPFPVLITFFYLLGSHLIFPGRIIM